MRNSKFDQVSSDGVRVGFDQDNFNYQIYDLSSRKFLISHNVTFEEETFPFRNLEEIKGTSSEQVKWEYSDDEDPSDPPDETIIVDPRIGESGPIEESTETVSEPRVTPESNTDNSSIKTL